MSGSRTAWVLGILSAGLVTGAYLVVWATGHGLASDAAASPYHVPAYLSLAILLIWVVLAASRALRLATGRAGAWPLDDRPLLLGLGALLAYIVLDVVWREIAPIGPGIEGALAPTRLLLAAGLALVAASPLRAARRGDVRTSSRRILTAVSAGLVAASLAFAILPINPVSSWWFDPQVASREDESEIWLMEADGSRQTRLLTAGDGFELSLPAWSPDGTRLVVTGWEILAGRDPAAQLWTSATDGSDLRRITEGPGWHWVPAWSPDGEWIAYTQEPSERPASPGGPAAPQPGRAPDSAPTRQTGADIWVVHPDGSGAKAVVAEVGADTGAAWSPDGSQLAFVSDRDGDADVYVTAADGSGTRQLTNDPGSDWLPAWSPDGTEIVFTSDRDGNHDIWRVGLDGGGLRQLTQGDALDAAPSWSRDGLRIAFTSDRSGDAEVWTMAADGSDLRNLSRSPSTNDGQWSVAWSPDGSRLAYASGGLPPVAEHPLIREDLAVATTLLNAALLAGVAVLIAGLSPILGGTAILLGIPVGLASLVGDDWRPFVAAVVLGLAVDLIVRVFRPRRRAPVMAALTAAAFAATIVLVPAAAGSSSWTPTLGMGVIVLAAIVGWMVGAIATRRRPAELSAQSMDSEASRATIGG